MPRRYIAWTTAVCARRRRVIRAFSTRRPLSRYARCSLRRRHLISPRRMLPIFRRLRSSMLRFTFPAASTRPENCRRTFFGPSGAATPGKVCLFLFNGDDADRRNETRLVPEQTTADDCAFYVNTNGGTHVRLGCSAGRWKLHWAPQRILAGPNGWTNRRDPLSGSQYVPDPDCGWG